MDSGGNRQGIAAVVYYKDNTRVRGRENCRGRHHREKRHALTTLICRLFRQLGRRKPDAGCCLKGLVSPLFCDMSRAPHQGSEW